jgi:hypothetical protein
MIEPLFPPGSKPHYGKKLQSMADYDYFLRSDRPHVEQVRRFWNRIFANCNLPNEARQDLRARFTSNSADSHMGALFELVMYELLVRTGHRVEYHKPLEKGRPDYLVKSPAGVEFYLEATCALGDEHPKKFENRLHAIVYDTIDGIESDRFGVYLGIDGTFNVTEISQKRLQEEVKNILQSTHHAQLLQDQETLEPSQLSGRYEKVIQVGGAKVFVMPKAIDPSGPNNGPGLIRQFHGQLQFVMTDDHLSKSLKTKADQFRKADLPIVIAVNILEPLLEQDDMLNALFGQERHAALSGGTTHGQIRPQQGPKGVWVHKGRSKNTSIAAVLFFARINHYAKPTCKPVMVLNPFIDRTIIPRTLPFVDYRLPSKDGLSWKDLSSNTSTANKEDWQDEWPLDWESYENKR